MSREEVAALEPTACIRCGRCVRACPESLVPVRLAQHADANDLDAFAAEGGMECMECGCCSYVCPARRRLTQSLKYGRSAVNAARRRKAAAKKETEGKA